MMLGLSLSTFTMLHVIISLVGIVSGLIVLFGAARLQPDAGLDRAVSSHHDPYQRYRVRVSVHRVVAVAYDRYSVAGAAGDRVSCALRHEAFRAWRWIYAVTAMIALYFNIFVLIIQSFLKIPALTALAPGNPPSGPAFAVVSGSCASILRDCDHRRCAAVFGQHEVRLRSASRNDGIHQEETSP